MQAERVVVVQDPEGAFAVRRTASKDNPEALQGFHAEHLLFLIDEASGIPDVVFEVGMGALSTPGAKVVMAGNPTRTSGFFYDTHHCLGAAGTRCMSAASMSRAPGTHRGHQGQVRRELECVARARPWRVSHRGRRDRYPSGAGAGGCGTECSSLDYYPVWGVDVARFGDDRTALAKRQANKLLEPIKWWNSTDLMATVGRIKAEYDETHYDMRPWAILIDVIGLGAGVYDRCKELGLPVKAINVGEAAATRENCMRLRDELWFKGREWFQERSCSMPQDDGLIAELTAPTYTFSSTGKMVVESKADMKKRGMRSPDLADAFLLTFAWGERRKERYRRPEPRNYSGWAA